MPIRDRIKDFRRVPAGQLRPNPSNWRTHSPEQTAALKGILADVGVADAVLARECPDGSLELVDGHLRTDVLDSTPIPTLVLDVTEEEAKKLLLTIDPLAAMAGHDDAMLAELLESVETEQESLASMLQTMGRSLDTSHVEEATVDDQSRLGVAKECPKCGAILE